MSSRKIVNIIIFLILFIGGFVFCSNKAFLYSPDSTHYNLTQEMIKFYNLVYDPDISNPRQIELILKGSMDEDILPRPAFHLYDPIYNRAPFGFYTAKQWALSPDIQKSAITKLATLLFQLFQQGKFSFHGDYSWLASVNSFAKNDLDEAWYGLGHILHLIEDMTVPAHSRNDHHIKGDPYEQWAEKIGLENYNWAGYLYNQGYRPKELNSLEEYFNEVAQYSNKYFFSKDTILHTDYSWPKIIEEKLENYGETSRRIYARGKDEKGELFRLAEVVSDLAYNKKEYLIRNSDLRINSDYWSCLAPKAVIYGAGVIKLFLEEAEKEAQKLASQPKNLSLLGQVQTFFKGLFNLGQESKEFESPTSHIEESMPSVEYLAVGPRIIEETKKNINDEPEAKPPIPPQGGFASGLSDETEQSRLSETFLVKKVIDGDTILLANGQEVRYIGIDAPEFLNGCFAQQSTDKNKELIEGKQIRLEKDISETDKYGRLLRYVYLDSLFINDYLVRNGYAYDFAYGSDTKYKEQFVKAEEEAKENRKGLWGDICHPQVVYNYGGNSGGGAGKSTGQQDEQEKQEGESEQDTTPPDIFINPLVYNYASSSFSVEWSSPEMPSVSFDIELKQGEGEWQNLLENTDETQIIFIAENQDTIYYFRVRAKDLAGNTSEWQETSIKILSKPVAINEIAWMGTKGSPQDEWIELFNRTDYDIDLTGWTLVSGDRSPEITLNNIILAKGYYLLERTNDETTSEPADWHGSFGSGGLNNTGEVLELRDNFGNVIDLVNSWHAGNNEEKRTMERINPAAAGTEPKNWKTYIGSGSISTDAKGNPILGTPKAKNSVYKIYTAVDKNIIENTTWILDNSPYLVYDNSGRTEELLKIAEGATLAIEPGVIIKFYNPGLKVFGRIKAEGTSDKPIVFTDYNDKEYAGEIFGNTASPQAGAWSGIWITESSNDSVFDSVIIRYAGSRSRPWRSGATYSFPGVAVGAGIRVEDTSIILKNSTIENNLFVGVLLTNSPNTVIENSTFQNHLEYDNSYTTLAKPTELRNMAIYIDSSNPQIKNSTFLNNLTGIYIVNNSHPASLVGGPIIENNSFSNNSRPVWVQSSYPEFSNNQIEGNQWDGIVLKGLKLTQDYTLGGGSVFINYDYPFWSLIVPIGYILTIEPGTIIKSIESSTLTIEGTLIAEGTAAKPIVFTSFYDDEYGGDTNGDGDWAEYCRTKDPDDNTYLNCPKPGSWGQIVFTETSTDSILDYVVIRYGGTKYSPYNFVPDYVLKINDSDLTLTNSIIENNISGFYLENSNSYIANTEFRNHQYSQSFSYFTSTGLYLSSSRPTIDISTFLNNKLGIYIDVGSWLDLNLTGLVFENNNKDFEDMRPPEE